MGGLLLYASQADKKNGAASFFNPQFMRRPKPAISIISSSWILLHSNIIVFNLQLPSHRHNNNTCAGYSQPNPYTLPFATLSSSPIHAPPLTKVRRQIPIFSNPSNAVKYCTVTVDGRRKKNFKNHCLGNWTDMKCRNSPFNMAIVIVIFANCNIEIARQSWQSQHCYVAFVTNSCTQIFTTEICKLLISSRLIINTGFIWIWSEHFCR